MASSSTELNIVNYGGSIGKGLSTKNKILKDSVIFYEDPIICCQFSWNKLYGYLCCDHCMQPLETTEKNISRLTQNSTVVLPYPDACPFSTLILSQTQCTDCGVSYCSSNCQTLAYDSYHAVLCLKGDAQNPSHPLNQLEEAWRNVHYPPETSSIMLMARMVAMVKQASNKQIIINKFSQFCQSTVNEIDQLTHKLMGEKFSNEIEHIRQLFIAALYDESLSSWFNPEGFSALLTLVGRNAQGIGTSPLSIWEKNIKTLKLSDDELSSVDIFTKDLYLTLDETVGQFIDNEGIGLYEKQSLLNHSCEPNSEIHFSGTSARLNLIALRDILPGEQVTISYLSECDILRSRHSRQTFLRENYLFHCDCPRCLSQADEASVTSDDESDQEEMDAED